MAEEEVRDLKHKMDSMHGCWLKDGGDHMAPRSKELPLENSQQVSGNPSPTTTGN